MKKRKRYVKIFGLLMAAGLLLLSGCGSFAKNTKPTADEKLNIAIKDRCKETLKEAIEDHADIEQLPYLSGVMTENGQYERNPLRVALWNWVNQDMIKMLLDAGANVNAYDADGCPVFFYSAYMDDTRLFQLMADYDPDLTLKNKEGLSVLEYYIIERSELGEIFPRRNLVKLMIDNGAPVTEDTLECAEQYGDYHILDLLYPKVQDCFNELQKQYLESNVKKANWILEQQEELSETDIAVAVIYGNQETIKILNKKQIDFSKIKPEERTLPEMAAWNQNLETVSAMLENEQTPVRFHKTAMITEVYYNDDVRLLKYLCENGWLDNIENMSEEEFAAYVSAGALKSVKYFLEHGYDISQGSSKGADPLMGTIGAENYDMTKLLLDYGADPNAEYTGDPVWIAACEQGNTEILDLMLEYGADLEYYGGLGMRQAIDYCNLDVIELLAQKGVKITEDLYQFSQENISSDHVREYVSKLYEQQQRGEKK